MIRSIAFDVEVLPNLFSVTFVDMTSYFAEFKDCTDGKPVPLVTRYKVCEITEKLNNVAFKSFVITDELDSDLLPLVAYLNQMTFLNNTRTDLFGFNSKSYDDYMIAGFLMYFNRFDSTKELCAKLYEISKHVIAMRDAEPEEFYRDSQMRMLKDYSLPYTSIDIMRIFGLNKVGVVVNSESGERKAYGKSLKQTSINLMWYQLLEWQMPPINDSDRKYYSKSKYGKYTNEELTEIINPFDRYILTEYVDDLLHYNLNDVFIVCEMVRMNMDEVRLRYSITNSYKVNVLSDARSQIADKLVVKLYSEMSGLRPESFTKLRTERTRLSFKKIIFPHIRFKTKQLQQFLYDMKKVSITRTNKDAFSEEINFYGTTYSVAVGGIHSVDPPRILTSTDEYTYIHYDINSYYPSIMIAYDVHPEHLNKQVFTKLVKYLRDTRVAAKHCKTDEQVVPGVPNKIAAEALKIVINSIFGKMGFEKGFLYDRFAQMQVTINGQLMTLMLIEELELNDIHVVSANTDGIVVKLPRNKIDTFDEITDQWKSKNQMGADYEKYEVYIERDINNYLDKQLDGTIEYKGDLDPYMYLKNLSKGYNAPIVAKAISAYFLDNVPIMETLTNCANILEFCKTQNVGRDWKLIFTRVVEQEIVETNYQRNTRFYVSKLGGVLNKVHPDGRKQNLCAGNYVTPINTLDDSPIYTRNIDYKYYYEECFKIINSIRLGVTAQGKGKTINRKLAGMYNNLFEFDND